MSICLIFDRTVPEEVDAEFVPNVFQSIPVLVDQRVVHHVGTRVFNVSVPHLRGRNDRGSGLHLLVYYDSKVRPTPVSLL